MKGKEIDEQVKKAYRAALAGVNGDVIRKDLEYYANKQSHVPGDPYATAFNDGMRVMARNFLLLGEADES